MTAHAQKEDIEKSLTAGMNAHLTKPIEPQKIFSLLTQWIKLDNNVSPENNQRAQQSVASNSQLHGDDFVEIDIKSALARTNKNQELLKKVLIMFMNTHINDGNTLNMYLREKNYYSIQALAHKIKGSAASIGANSLSAAAGLVEKSCKEKSYSNCEQLISNTNHKLLLVVNELKKISPAESLKIKRHSSHQDIKHNIDRFISLSESDLAAAEKVLLEIIETNPKSAIAADILKHFDNFNIDAIYPLLNSFALSCQPENTVDAHISPTGY